MGPHPDELAVLVDQLVELLDEGATDEDEALEIAVVAGLATRLDADPELLALAEAWRRGPGADLLKTGFAAIDVDALVEPIDEVSGAEVDEEEADEAVNDFDDLVAAAAWAGRADLVRDAAHRAAEIIRTLPDAFAYLAPDGDAMVRTATVGADPDLYDYWYAIVEAGAWADNLDNP
jgi:hypothetical protein